MAAGYLAALLPTLALVAGSLVYLARWLRRPAAPEGVTLALGLVTFAAVVAMTLQVPAYGMVKSFYGLGALLPLCVFVAVGVDALSARWRWSSVLALVLLGAWALLSYGAMWVDADSPRARTFRALAELQEGATREGAARLREAMARHPSDWTTRDAMLQFLTWRRAPRSEFAAALGAGERIEPDVAARHVALGHFALLGGDPREAWLEARRAVALDPDLPDARALEATLAERRGDVAGAIAGWREALRIEPFYARAHESLARLLPLAGAPDSAATHRDLAARIRAAGL